MNYLELEKEIEYKLKVLKESLEKEIRKEISFLNETSDFLVDIKYGQFNIDFKNKEKDTLIFFNFGTKIEPYMLDDIRANTFYITSQKTYIKNTIKKNLNNILELVKKYQKYFGSIEFDSYQPEIYYEIEPKFKFETSNPHYLNLITKNLSPIIRLVEKNNQLQDLLTYNRKIISIDKIAYISPESREVILKVLVENDILIDNMQEEDLKVELKNVLNDGTLINEDDFFKKFIEDFNVLFLNSSDEVKDEAFKKLIKTNNFNFLNKYIGAYFSKENLDEFINKFKNLPKYEDLLNIKTVLSFKNIKTDKVFNFEIDNASLEIKLLNIDKEFQKIQDNKKTEHLNKLKKQIDVQVSDLTELDFI